MSVQVRGPKVMSDKQMSAVQGGEAVCTNGQPTCDPGTRFCLSCEVMELVRCAFSVFIC
jgi:hypothetical protein